MSPDRSLRVEPRGFCAVLGWRQMDLANAAEVGLATVARIERGEGMVQGNFSTIAKIQDALEKEGVSFVAEPGGEIGVRLKKQSPRG